MNENDLSFIFGKTNIWDLLVKNTYQESFKYDQKSTFISCTGVIYTISNIKVCRESGVVSFQKSAPDLKPVKVSLVFIKEKSTLVGFEGTKQVKYIKTSKKSFS